MSPSACYSVVAACKTERDLSAMVGGGSKGGTYLGQFEVARKQQYYSDDLSNSALRVGKESHRIRKPPLPLPQVQYRPPIIIHTYSPKVIHTQPDDFMSLVQKLTGSSDTRLRLRKSPSRKISSKKLDVVKAQVASTDVVREDTARSASITQGGPSMSNCSGSPSSSEDSATFLTVPHDPSSFRGDGAATSTFVVKQSNSPRSPLDSNFEFETASDSLLLNHFSGFTDVAPPAGSSTTSMFHPHHVVKAESNMVAFHDTNPVMSNFFADFVTSSQLHHHHLGPQLQGATPSRPAPKPAQPRPQAHQHLQHHHQHQADNLMVSNFGVNIDRIVSVSPGQLLAPSQLSAGCLPELAPQGWSQSNLNILDAGSHFTNQASTFLRQRHFSSIPTTTYTASPEGNTMVALENIHAFMLT